MNQYPKWRCLKKMKNDKKQNLPWRQQKREFPYKEDPLTDKKYLKDRAELFRKHGNGWWWLPEIAKLANRR